MSQRSLYAQASRQPAGATPQPLLQSLWELRRQPSVPDPFQRVLITDMDDMGMVSIQPAASASVARSARILGFPVRWITIASLLREYEESPA